MFKVYKAFDLTKPTGPTTPVATETCGHGEDLYRKIRAIGSANGLGKYQIFNEDFGHIHIFEHGWIKRTAQ